MIDKKLLESSSEVPLTDEDRQRIEKLLTKQTKGFAELKSAIANRVDELIDESIKGGPGSGRYPKDSGNSSDEQKVMLDWLVEKMTSSKPLGNVRQITDDELTEHTSEETAGVIKQVVKDALVHLANIGWRAGFAKSDQADSEKLKELLNGLLVKYVTEQNKSLKGGHGSGNFGHAGRPGERGGSGEGGGGNEFEKISNKLHEGDTKSQFFHNGKWDESRVKSVHEPALHSYTEGVTKAADGKPVLYMTGGGYGSGKSGLLDKFPEAVGFPSDGQSARVDPDATKGFIPEYQKMASGPNPDPGAASYVHEESSDVAKMGVKDALGNGYNVTYDTSGDTNPDKLAAKIEAFRAAGATQVIGNYAFPGSIEEGQRRADYRAEHSEGLRRYVDPAVLAANHAEVSRTWLALADRGVYDKLGLWSTAGPLGTPPTLIASAEGGKIHVVDAATFDKFKKIGGR